MNAEFYITIVTMVSGMLSLFIKSFLENRKNKKSLSARDKILTNELRGLQNKVVNIGMAIDELKQDTEFRNILKNSIRIEATRIINLSYNLDQNYKDVLMFWAVQVEALALKFYYSPYRNNPIELEKYLTCDVDSRKQIVKNYSNNIIDYVKVYRASKIFFIDFLEETQAYRKLDLLLIRMVQNGLSKDDVTQLFTKFIDEFFENIIKSVMVWQNLDDGHKEI